MSNPASPLPPMCAVKSIKATPAGDGFLLEIKTASGATVQLDFDNERTAVELLVKALVAYQRRKNATP